MNSSSYTSNMCGAPDGLKVGKNWFLIGSDFDVFFLFFFFLTWRSLEMVISCDIQNGKQGDWFIGDILKDIYIYIYSS